MKREPNSSEVVCSPISFWRTRKLWYGPNLKWKAKLAVVDAKNPEYHRRYSVHLIICRGHYYHEQTEMMLTDLESFGDKANCSGGDRGFLCAVICFVWGGKWCAWRRIIYYLLTAYLPFLRYGEWKYVIWGAEVEYSKAVNVMRCRINRGKVENAFVLHINAWIVRNKWIETLVMTGDSNAAIVGVAMTWLSESDHKPVLFLKGE